MKRPSEGWQIAEGMLNADKVAETTPILSSQTLEDRLRVIEQKLGIIKPTPKTCTYRLKTRCGCTREYTEKFPPAPNQRIAMQIKSYVREPYLSAGETWSFRHFDFKDYNATTNTAFYEERLS